MAFRNQLQMVILVQLPINQLMLSCVTLWFCNNSNSITRNYNVFIGCSEISIYVIVKHLKYVGITWSCSLPWADLLSFSVPGGNRKNCWVVVCQGDSVPRLALCQMLPSSKSQIPKFSFATMIANIQPSYEKIPSYASGAACPKPMILWPYKNH